MSRTLSNLFRINLAEYFLIDDYGAYKRIVPRPRILFDNDALVIVSKLDQKVYDFTGINASEKKQTASVKLAKNLGVKHGLSVERIIYPSESIAPEHLQFIEYLIDEYYFAKMSIDMSEHYRCYFCEQLLEESGKSCASCGKEIIECFVCNSPILYGDLVGKCSLCGAAAHLVHFYEWLKALGMCAKCNEKLHPEGIIPIIEDNKETFFEELNPEEIQEDE
ncbi:MAG: hypothetical protein KAX09_06800 [Candidatus Heimdallarchaeota archaeon]|nr:hypothetical protein [Candidatus Heimdallarchaeota archaeon]MCK4290676.1 hypothetical protein [Candidatus Heimdallarchaeota archaeon]